MFRPCSVAQDRAAVIGAAIGSALTAVAADLAALKAARQPGTLTGQAVVTVTLNPPTP